MLSFNCQDIGKDCDNKEIAETKEEIEKKIRAHYKIYHYTHSEIPKSEWARIEKAIKL